MSTAHRHCEQRCAPRGTSSTTVTALRSHGTAPSDNCGVAPLVQRVGTALLCTWRSDSHFHVLFAFLDVGVTLPVVLRITRGLRADRSRVTFTTLATVLQYDDDDTLCETLYRVLVLVGLPARQHVAGNAVWAAVFAELSAPATDAVDGTARAPTSCDVHPQNLCFRELPLCGPGYAPYARPSVAVHVFFCSESPWSRSATACFATLQRVERSTRALAKRSAMPRWACQHGSSS